MKPLANPVLAGSGALLAIALGGPVRATAADWPASAPAPQAVFENVEYRFKVRDYTPPQRLVPVTRDHASYSTPEDAATAILSARLAQDRAWWRASWVEAAGERQEEALRRAEAAAGDELARATVSWERIQRDELGGREITFSHRIDSGPFVILVFRARDPKQRDPRFAQQTLVLREQGGRWLATDELRSNDPVLLYWSNPGTTARTIGR